MLFFSLVGNSHHTRLSSQTLVLHRGQSPVWEKNMAHVCFFLRLEMWTLLACNVQMTQMLNSVCDPYPFPRLIGSLRFLQRVPVGNCSKKWRGRQRSKFCIYPFKPGCWMELHGVPASTSTSVTQVCEQEIEWNERSTFTPFFLFNSYEKINSSFLWVKGHRSRHNDENICNTWLFEVHNLLLWYMNLYEKLLCLSQENSYIAIIYVTCILETWDYLYNHKLGRVYILILTDMHFILFLKVIRKWE